MSVGKGDSNLEESLLTVHVAMNVNNSTALQWVPMLESD